MGFNVRAEKRHFKLDADVAVSDCVFLFEKPHRELPWVVSLFTDGVMIDAWEHSTREMAISTATYQSIKHTAPVLIQARPEDLCEETFEAYTPPAEQRAS